MRPAAWDERGERVAGTDHGGEGGPEIGSETRAESPRGPTFILVAPQMGENIGAAARAMWRRPIRTRRHAAAAGAVVPGMETVPAVDRPG